MIATATLAPRLAYTFIDPILAPGTPIYQAAFNQLLQAGVAMPFWVNGFGVLASLIGIMYVRGARLTDTASLSSLLSTVSQGVWLSSGLTLGATVFCTVALFPSHVAWPLFGCVVVGLVAGVIIAEWTTYCTAYEHAPTQGIAAASQYGPSQVIVQVAWRWSQLCAESAGGYTLLMRGHAQLLPDPGIPRALFATLISPRPFGAPIPGSAAHAAQARQAVAAERGCHGVAPASGCRPVVCRACTRPPRRERACAAGRLPARQAQGQRIAG